MPRGGARNRSGPQPQEGSGSSERRGYRLAALPAEGYRGEAPEFPLEEPTDRELEVWAWAWRTPQACAWSLPSEQWRIRTVALWVRQSVRCEAHNASANQLAQLHRFGDQIGMTTAGLAEMGWKVAVDEVAEKAADRKPLSVPAPRRLRAAGSGGE
jgi:hypothetical protein